MRASSAVKSGPRRELLLAMLVMEAAFGLPGLVAAPVFYAYVKRELVDQRWI